MTIKDIVKVIPTHSSPRQPSAQPSGAARAILRQSRLSPVALTEGGVEQELTDEGLVEVDKIGSSNIFWACAP